MIHKVLVFFAKVRSVMNLIVCNLMMYSATLARTEQDAWRFVIASVQISGVGGPPSLFQLVPSRGGGRTHWLPAGNSTQRITV